MPPLSPDWDEFPPVGRDDVAERIAQAGNPEHAVWVARDGAEIVGTAACRPELDKGEAALEWLAVGEPYRRQRIGTALLDRCLELAAASGAQSLRTAAWVDSRFEPAVRFLEASGFVVHEPERHNITMELDIDRWRSRPPELPAAYELTTFQPGDEREWTRVRSAVFGECTVGWFVERFSSRPNFDPGGWFFVEHEGRKVGITGAMVHYHDAARTKPKGAIIEYVGTLEEHRGRGLGEALMVACLNWLKPKRPRPTLLITQPFRVPAVTLYKKLGFEVRREHRTYVRQLPRSATSGAPALR